MREREKSEIKVINNQGQSRPMQKKEKKGSLNVNQSHLLIIFEKVIFDRFYPGCIDRVAEESHPINQKN